MKPKRLSGVALCALSFAVLTGPWLSPAIAQEEPQAGGTLVLATQGEPSTYDCHAGTSITALQYLAPHYSTLLKFNPENYPEIVGDVAQSWSVSDDYTSFEVTLRPGITFHDGTELTPEDVKATFERIANPPEGVVSVRQSAFDDLESIEITGPDTLVFHLAEPSLGFLSTLASPWNCIYSAELLESDPTYPSQTIMGTGPFTFTEHVAGASWKGSRFEDYFVEGKPYLDGFEALVVSGAAVLNSIAGDQVHANLRLISVPDKERIEDARGDEVVFQSTPATSVTLLTVNAQRPPFDDVRVRRALSLAIDRHLGTRALGDIASQRWPHLIFRHGHALAPDMEELKTYPGFGEDIEAARAEARQLLEEAGASDLEFTLLNRNLQTPYQPLGIFFIDQWRQIGLNVTMEAVDTPTWSARLASGDYDVAIDLNAPVSDEPTEVLQKYVPGSTTENSGIEDEQLVNLFEEQNVTVDPAERERLIKTFVDRVVELNYVLPTFNAERIVVHDKAVKGWTVAPSFYVGLDLSGVWLDEE